MKRRDLIAALAELPGDDDTEIALFTRGECGTYGINEVRLWSQSTADGRVAEVVVSL